MTLGFLRRNLRVNSPSIKSMAYKSLVRLILEYSSAAFLSYTNNNIYKVEMVQRRAARFVSTRYHNTSSAVSEMLKICNGILGREKKKE